MASVWLDVMQALRELETRIGSRWPQELPPENTPGFWWQAAQAEMQTRDSVTAWLRSIAAGQAPRPTTALEDWMIRRRLEWAAQLVLATAEEGIEPDGTLAEVLEWALVRSWESDGCIALWNHAERGGQSP